MTQPFSTELAPAPDLTKVLEEGRATAAVSTVTAKLTAAGFVQDAALKTKYIAQAKKQGLSNNGAYNIQSVWTRGSVVLKFEQNTATEDVGGLQAAITHPSVCVVYGPMGNVACNADDVELILSVAHELG